MAYHIHKKIGLNRGLLTYTIIIRQRVYQYIAKRILAACDRLWVAWSTKYRVAGQARVCLYFRNDDNALCCELRIHRSCNAEPDYLMPVVCTSSHTSRDNQINKPTNPLHQCSNPQDPDRLCASE